MTNTEINEAVARKLGWNLAGGRWIKRNPDGVFIVHPMPPDYSGSIAAAWEVAEHLQKLGLKVEIGLWPDATRCVIHVPGKRINEEADNAPMAICNAFLKLDD